MFIEAKTHNIAANIFLRFLSGYNFIPNTVYQNRKIIEQDLPKRVIVFGDPPLYAGKISNGQYRFIPMSGRVPKQCIYCAQPAVGFCPDCVSCSDRIGEIVRVVSDEMRQQRYDELRQAGCTEEDSLVFQAPQGVCTCKDTQHSGWSKVSADNGMCEHCTNSLRANQAISICGRWQARTRDETEKALDAAGFGRPTQNTTCSIVRIPPNKGFGV